MDIILLDLFFVYAVAMQHVVTLVHGTWGSGAAWCLKDSPLRKSIESGLAGPVIFQPFEWNGRNSIRARAQAAKELTTHLSANLDRYPDARHYVIGHSHGGNVLLGAMSDSIAERLCGVVCLSTPFLSVQRRPSRLLFNSIIVAFYFLSLSLALVVLCVIENALGVSLRINNYIMIPIFFYIDDVGKRLRRFCQAYIDGLEPLIRVPGSITSCRLLIVRSAADEATAALLSAQFARWLLQMFSKTFLEKIPDKLNLRLKQLFSPMSKFKIITLVVLSIYGSALAALFLDAQRLQVLGIGILVTFVGTPVILSLLFLLLSLCCAFCGLILMLPIGFDAMLASLLLEISAETTPSGIWTIYQANVSLSGPRLRHSSPQDEDICLKFIAEWMAQST